MVITEIIDNKYIKHYSDAGFYIRKTDTEEIYEEAIDLISVFEERNWHYEETDTPIEEPTEEDYAEAGRILMGDEVSDNEDN